MGRHSRHRRSLPAALALAAALGGVCPAQEQGPKKGQQPAQGKSGGRVEATRPGDKAPPKGVGTGELYADRRLGPFFYRPSAELLYGYDDNVNASSGNGRSGSQYYNARADIALVLPPSTAHIFTFAGSVGYRDFIAAEGQSYVETAGALAYNFNGSRHSFGLANRYETTRRRDDFETNDRIRVFTNFLSANWDYQMSDGIAIRVAGSQSAFNYDNGQVSGGVDVATTLDRRENYISVSSLIRVADTLRVEVRGGYGRWVFSDPNNPRRGKNRSLSAGFNFDPGGRFSGGMSFGLSRFLARQSQNGGNFRGLSIQGDLQARVNDSSQLRFHLTRGPRASLFSDLGLQSSYGLTYTYQVNEKIGTTTSFDFGRQHFFGTSTVVLPDGSVVTEEDREDTVLNLAFRATYVLNGHFSTVGHISRNRRRSDLNELAFSSNNFQLGLLANF
jgi:hypothetical protein